MTETVETKPARAANGTATAPPCTLVIFGASGDLTKRLLMPALYNLAGEGLLADEFAVRGLDHNDNTDEGWRADLTAEMHALTKDPAAEFHADHVDEAQWGFVRDRLHFSRGDFLDAETYRALGEAVSGSAIFYLAVAAKFFGPVVEGLGKAGLLREGEGRFRRVVIEKPFGSDLASARALNGRLLAQADERQVFRIDHFLGKETVQGILALRFANATWEPVWNRTYIDHVEITAAETIGVEHRGAFYEPTGALRDMVPNHLFQLLAMVAMDEPASLDAEAVRDAKAALVSAIRPIAPGDAARGQYGPGEVQGSAVPGYRSEPDVAPDSRTETYAAVRLGIDNPRWAGVPFYLRSGKRLGHRLTEVAVHFKPPAHALFPGPAPSRNVLHFRVDPEPGVRSSLNAKAPGPEMTLGPVVTAFRYADFFAETPNVGYETLFYDCMVGDVTLFQRADAIEAAWATVQPLLDAWQDAPAEPYAAGGEGPAGAASLLARDGRSWMPLDGGDGS